MTIYSWQLTKTNFNLITNRCEEQINECESNPCQNKAKCYDLIGGYYCQCPIGYTGPDCNLRISSCVSVPCLNGGICRDNVNSYGFTCLFLPGFIGLYCEQVDDVCKSNPCRNGASCYTNKPSKFM